MTELSAWLLEAGATSVNFEKAGTNSKASLPLSPQRFFMMWSVSA